MSLPFNLFVLRSIVFFAALLTFLKSAIVSAQLSVLAEKKLYYDSVYHEAIRSGDQLMLAEAYYLYGKYHDNKGEYKEALSFLRKALEIHQNYPPSYEHGRVYYYLAVICRNLHLDELALDYNISAYELYLKCSSEKGLALSIAIFEAYSLEGNKRAKEYLQKLSADERKAWPDLVEDSMVKEESELSKVILQVKQGEYREALPVLERHVKFWENRPGKEFHSMLSRLYRLEAIQMLDKSRDIDLELGAIAEYIKQHFEEQMVVRQMLRKLSLRNHENKGEWQKAFELQREWYENEISNIRANEEGALAELHVAYETEKKEQQLVAQQREIKIRNRLLIILAVTVFVIAFIGVFFFRLYRKNARLTRRNFYLLKEQNHRVKNNLQQTINLLSLQGRRLHDAQAKRAIEESKHRIGSMSILQKMLYEDNAAESLSVNLYFEEIAESLLAVYGFQDIERESHLQDIRVSPEDAMALGLVLTELLTNACKYAFPFVANPCLKLSFLSNGTEGFIFKYSDNGPGLPASPTRLGSFGMTLIELEAKYFQANYHFRNHDGLNFTMAGRFKIPLI